MAFPFELNLGTGLLGGGALGAAPVAIDFLGAPATSILPTYLLMKELSKQQGSDGNSENSSYGMRSLDPVTSTAAQNYQASTGVNGPIQGVTSPNANMGTQQVQLASTQPLSGVGVAPTQEPVSGLAGPANLDPNAVAAATNANNTAAAQGWWDTVGQGLTGQGLEGDALKDWQRTAAVASLLTNLGSNIAGDHWVGRWGKGMNDFIQSGLIDKNNQQAEGGLASDTQNMLGMFGGGGSSQNASGQTGTQAKANKQPTPNTYQSSQSANYGKSNLQANNRESMLAQIRALGLV